MPRFLFDENLSPKLVARLASTFPNCQHVRDLQLRGAADLDLWTRAARDGLTIVTKDDDFRQLAFVHGGPPKVIWLVVGNAGTETIAQLLERQRAAIDAFDRDAIEVLLVLRLLPR